MRSSGNSALTWTRWSGFGNFLELAGQIYPEIEWEYTAQQALWDGRASLMTYVGWENVLADIGQAYKDWSQGENGMDGPGCIARMDEL